MYRQGYMMELPNRNSRKRKKSSASEEIHCSVCDLWVIGVSQYQDHIKGGRHLRKGKEAAAHQVVMRSPFISHDEATGRYSCSICSTTLNSAQVTFMHVSSLRHVETVNNASKHDAFDPTPKKPWYDRLKTPPTPLTEQELAERRQLEVIAKKMRPANINEPTTAGPMTFSCDVCDIRTNSEVQLKHHLASSKHLLKCRDPSAVPPRPNVGLVQFRCSTCNIWVNSQAQLTQHLGSFKHKNNLNNGGNNQEQPGGRNQKEQIDKIPTKEEIVSPQESST